MPANAPIAGKFEKDPRVHFDKTAGKFQYEDDDTGKEYEWTGTVWVELVEESAWKAQQAAYSVAGVDESTPANAVVAREEKRVAKRKKGEKDYTTNTSSTSTSNGAGPSSAMGTGPGASTTSKPQAPPAPPKKTAVFVTNLPPNTTSDLLSSTFSKAGVLLIGDDGEPRVKMYYDDEGTFKGEALVIYFKEGSVDLAITLLDDTELELGGGFGNMRVKVAEYEKSSSNGEGMEKKKTTANGDPPSEKKKLSAEEKHRMSKRIKTMQSKVTWTEEDDYDDPLAPEGGAPAPLANRMNRVVVLKGMFTVEDLDKDASLLVELKEDVREEAETLGVVTSLQLYYKEEDGVMTIKFKDASSAQACILKMNGRYFDGRRIHAGLYNGKERFSKSGATTGIGDDEDGEAAERARLDNFANWLVEGEEGD